MFEFLKQWLLRVRGDRDTASSLLSRQAKIELAGRIEALLVDHQRQFGGESILKPQLSVVVRADGVVLSSQPDPAALATVELAQLHAVLAFLLVRGDSLAVPRDAVGTIAREAAREVSRQIRELERSSAAGN